MAHACFGVTEPIEWIIRRIDAIHTVTCLSPQAPSIHPN